MRAAVSPLIIAGLAACATTAGPGGVPSREDMAAALRAWLTCDGEVVTNCVSPPDEILVHSLRCRPAEEPGHGSQVLCHFSYTAGWPWTGRTGPECAWLSRDAAGAWRIDSYPDADVCDS